MEIALNERERGPFPFALSEKPMEKNPVIASVEQFLGSVLEEYPAFFMVQVKVKPTNNVKVYLDGDQGITIDDCIKINRKLYALLESSGLFPEGDFSLEVSSPGVGEPLLHRRQWGKNTGRLLEVILEDGSTLLGTLTAVGDQAATLETVSGKGKKAVHQTLEIPLDQVKTARVQIQF